MTRISLGLFATVLYCLVIIACIDSRFIIAGEADSETSEESTQRKDIFTRTTFVSRVFDYITGSHMGSSLHNNNIADLGISIEEDNSGSSPRTSSDSSSTAGPSSGSVGADEDDFSKLFYKYKGKPYSAEEYDRKLREILLTPDPLYGTDYNREWGRGCLTIDGEIPNTEFLVHFDVYDPFTPPGLDFEDLRCLHLYSVKEGYSLYKLRMGDMVVTFLPELEQVSLHLFEDYWGQMVVRVLYTVNGVLNRHEYTEQSRGSKTFHKTMGPTIHYSAPKVDSTDLNKWLDEKYRDLSKRRPPIIEEVLHYS